MGGVGGRGVYVDEEEVKKAEEEEEEEEEANTIEFEEVSER